MCKELWNSDMSAIVWLGQWPTEITHGSNVYSPATLCQEVEPCQTSFLNGHQTRMFTPLS